MKYTNADHTIIDPEDGSGRFIPVDPGNIDYQQILEAGGTIANYVVVVAVPEVITRRQFFQQLAIMTLITQSEALAAVTTHAIPTAMQAFVNALPSDQQFGALMSIQGSDEFHRHHPLVVTFGQMQGMSESQVDTLWLNASTL